MRAEVPILQLKCACCRGFRRCGGDKGAMETDEVCGRPLETFGASPPMFLELYRSIQSEPQVRWINTRALPESVTN